MMRGYITELDFEKVDEEFPGIVRYYVNLKEKPDTFLELLWGFTHQARPVAEPLVVSRTATTYSNLR